MRRAWRMLVARRGVWACWLALAVLVLLAPAWAPAQVQSPAGWLQVASGVDVDLYGVHFPSPTVGYVVGDQSMILRTLDRGVTWDVQGFRSARRLSAVRAILETHVWAVGEEGLIRFTTDGTSASGNWQTLPSPISRHLRSISLVAEPEVPTAIQYGMLVGDLVTVRTTEPTGRSWQVQVFLPPAGTLSQPTLYGVAVRSASQGLIVGERAIYYTVTAGTWAAVSRPETFYSVSWGDDTTAWAVGENGTILKTSDGGATWTAQPSGTSATLYGVFFADAQTGWAVGAGGTVLHTTDGGATWRAQDSGVSADLRGIWFTSGNDGWVVGTGGVILHTTTAGQPPATPTPPATGTPRPPAATMTPTPRPTVAPTAPRVYRVFLPSVLRAARLP